LCATTLTTTREKKESDIRACIVDIQKQENMGNFKLIPRRKFLFMNDLISKNNKLEYT
jgi:hypothetical protein